jgi:hypothetical protein
MAVKGNNRETPCCQLLGHTRLPVKSECCFHRLVRLRINDVRYRNEQFMITETIHCLCAIISLRAVRRLYTCGTNDAMRCSPISIYILVVMVRNKFTSIFIS